MRSSSPLTSQEQEIDNIIKSGNAIVAIAFDYETDTNGVPTINYSYGIDDHYLTQIANPNDRTSRTSRPSRAAKFFGSEQDIPQYSFTLLSVETQTSIPAEVLRKAEADNMPILIKRGTSQFSVYGFNYYRDPNWKEASLDNLTAEALQQLQGLIYDGGVFKNEEVVKELNNNLYNGPARQLFSIVQQCHSYLPYSVPKMNMQTRDVLPHKPGRTRFDKHREIHFKHTAKMSTSLMPTDPNYMELFHCDYGVGFLWHIDDCNLHDEKYVFPENAGTDGCYWIDLNEGYARDPKDPDKIRYFTMEEKIKNLLADLAQNPILGTVQSLREKNAAAVHNKKPIYWNELVIGLPEGRVNATFATQDVRNVRLRALRLAQRTKEKLNLKEDLPVFINQPYYAQTDDNSSVPNREAVYRFYSKEEQAEDLAAELVDEKSAQAVAEIIKNQRAITVSVSNKSAIDCYLNQDTQVDAALLPADPKWMRLSTDNNLTVGLLWDSNTCQYDKDLAETLREKNNNAVNQKNVIDRNTLPATLPKDQLQAIICYANNNYDSTTRLKALEMAVYVKEKLKLDANVPVFFVVPGEQYRLYSDLEQTIDKNQMQWQHVQPANAKQQKLLVARQSFTGAKNSHHKFMSGLFSRCPVASAALQEEDADWVKVSAPDEDEAEWVNVLKP